MIKFSARGSIAVIGGPIRNTGEKERPQRNNAVTKQKGMEDIGKRLMPTEVPEEKEEPGNLGSKQVQGAMTKLCLDHNHSTLKRVVPMH